MTVDSTLLHPDTLQALHDTPEVFAEIGEFQGGELGLQKHLRARYPDHIVRAALIMCDLRQRAAARYSRADAMWFDRTGLEQATSESIARHKAQRFSGTVVDICAGIGGDSIALGAHGCGVVSIDRVAARGLCLTWNAEAYGVADRVQVRTELAHPEMAKNGLVHIDPDRRAGPRGRSLRIEDLEPSPAFLEQLMQSARGGAIKLSPASNFRGSFADTEIELVSARGECREAIVWFGELQSDCSVRATVVETEETIAGHLSYDMADVRAPLRYVFDPDPALVRSGLLDSFCLQHGLNRLDPEEEYLTADNIPPSGFLPGVFEVDAQLPNDVKRLRRYLREHDVGRIEIKARRVPTNVEKLRRDLKLKGTQPATVIVARLNGQARILVARRLPR